MSAAPAARAAAASLYPTMFLCHGGGPLPVLGDPSHKALVSEWARMIDSLLKKYGKPRAIVVVSAHFETEIASVGGCATPKMLYDYGGFPRESYSLQYPAPGEPALAARLVSALEGASIKARLVKDRPYDHGVFVPLMKLFPAADIPVVPLSVLHSQDPGQHMAMGLALRQFREEGVFFIGSGSPMHNFKYIFAQRGVYGVKFNDALTSVLCDASLSAAERMERMKGVASFPGVEESQPPGAMEHLMPLLTTVGLAGGTAAREWSKGVTMMASDVRQYVFEE